MSQSNQGAGFVKGLIAKAPPARSPDFVKAKLSIKREELIAWLMEQEGEWINLDIKESRGGSWYASMDDWKPQRQGGDSASRGGQGPDSQGGHGNGTPRRNGPPASQRPPAAAVHQHGFRDDDMPFASSAGLF